MVQVLSDFMVLEICLCVQNVTHVVLFLLLSININKIQFCPKICDFVQIHQSNPIEHPGTMNPHWYQVMVLALPWTYLDNLALCAGTRMTGASTSMQVCWRQTGYYTAGSARRASPSTSSDMSSS